MPMRWMEVARVMIPFVAFDFLALSGRNHGDAGREVHVEEERQGDVYWMKKALDEARLALDEGEFPVGCVVVSEGGVVATGRRRGTAHGPGNELDHAEVVALRTLMAQGGLAPGKRATLYCTMEPCLMCFAAILLSDIGRVVWAFEDVMGGGTSCDLSSVGPLYQEKGLEVVSRVRRNESLALFKAFFSRPDNAYWQGSFLEQYTLKAAVGA